MIVGAGPGHQTISARTGVAGTLLGGAQGGREVGVAPALGVGAGGDPVAVRQQRVGAVGGGE
ncbi:hypothetical protein [Streptomyces sp. NRRL WC-3742]|uniref:hypothetical protein n=1 Tax=Streptomyces sp. NRRL WC-3742 TaxID=1463934 RepID=UPI0004C94486|nr:hypothetical protein [Streptomyces sp. NRRL WC-3742]